MALARDQILWQIDEVLESVSGFDRLSMSGTAETTRLAAAIDRLAPANSMARQAGGHWFEPSTAHLHEAPLRRGFLVSRVRAPHSSIGTGTERGRETRARR
jgi:hypothetical protein